MGRIIIQILKISDDKGILENDTIVIKDEKLTIIKLQNKYEYLHNKLNKKVKSLYIILNDMEVKKIKYIITCIY